MHKKKASVITLDGVSGAGKGTIGLKLARRLQWHYLDSGIFYRLLALEADQQLVSFQDEAALAQLAAHIRPQLHIQENTTDTSTLIIIWKAKNVTRTLRTEEYALKASKVAVYPLVRTALLGVQRSFQEEPGLIADGRDMGEVIFPNALYKFFLTASVDVRIKRRQIQLKQQGNYASLNATKNTIVQRDESDRGRIMATPDACVIDTTYLSITQVMSIIEQKLSAIGLYFH